MAEPAEDNAKTSETKPNQTVDKPAEWSTATSRTVQLTVPRLRMPRWKGASIVLALVIGLVGGYVGSYVYVHGWGGNAPVITDRQQLVVQESSATIDVVKKVNPAVVSITTQITTQGNGFFDFGPQTTEGAGTGMILTSTGLILTNNHVIDGSTSVSVFTSDGKEYSGKVLATNPNSDYAFVKINAKNLPTVSLGSSSAVEVGEHVIAIGNALGQYQNTVTEGVISGKGRPVTASDQGGGGTESLSDLFQTDAAINPGNSGGPLINLQGQVIGMNTAVADSSSGAQNIGFAIPIDEIKKAIGSVEQTGKLSVPYLGVRYISITPDVAAADNLPVSNGAYVSGGQGQPAVISGSPADKAGIQEGDIVTKINGTAIDQSSSLTYLISQRSVGDKVTLTVLRGNKTITLTATLAQAPTS